MVRGKEESGKRMSLRDKVKKRAEEREKQGGSGFRYNLPEGTDFFAPKKGTMNIDILPYMVTVNNHPSAKEGELWFQRTVFVHYGVGIEEKTFLCLKTIHKKCPICDHRAQLIKDGDADEELVKALKSKERELYNVVDLGEEDKGVQLWDISYHLFGKHLEEEVRNGKDEWAGFAELKGGYTLQVRFAEKVLGKNKFLEVTRIDFTEREDYPDTILKDVFDLDKVLNVLDYEQLEKVFLEIEEPEAPKGQDEESADESPKSQPPARTRSQKQPVEEAPPAEEKKIEVPASSKRTRPAPPQTKSEGMKCPHGGTFGKDVNELEECAVCDVWDKCDEEAVRLEKIK